MNNDAMKEVLNELFSHLERLETQSEAILQFLKEKKRVTDKQLAPYLEQAGNASNVKWRAARVRINHLLEPEHPEKEIKLGKKPELHEDSARADSSKDKQTEEVGKEEKQTEADSKDNPAPATTVETRPTNRKARKQEKSESTQGETEQDTQTKQEQDSDSVHHPIEVTEPLARQESADPAAQLKSDKKNSQKEAA